MLLIFLVVTVCLIFQIHVVNRYGIFGNKNLPQNIKTLLNYKGTHPESNLLTTLCKLHSCIYNRQIREKERESFLATLIHDLKTPAIAQARTLELLLAGKFGHLNKLQETVIQEMLLSEKYLYDIVINILTAYKCDCNKLILNKTSYDIKTQIRDICSILNKLAAEKNQKLLLNLPENQSMTYSDKFQIQRVITNLISNAIKYGEKDSKIIIDLTTGNQSLNFSVTNKSIFIPKEKISKIFDKFSCYNSVASSNAGTGLGLYLSKKIIELHGGKIYAESFLDGTCIFGFRLRSKAPVNKEKIALA